MPLNYLLPEASFEDVISEQGGLPRSGGVNTDGEEGNGEEGTERTAAGRAATLSRRASTLTRAIPPPAQREMSARMDSTVVEVAASHSNYVSQPAAVADLIKKAASEVSPAAR